MSGNEATAKILGYAGLIPFIVFSTASWTALPFIIEPSQTLVGYAAIILSFMGAIHWGTTISNTGNNHGISLVISVMPALTAWLTLSLAETLSLIILIAGFILLLGYDIHAAKSDRLPNWYIAMRIRLTIVVTSCLVITLIAEVSK